MSHFSLHPRLSFFLSVCTRVQYLLETVSSCLSWLTIPRKKEKKAELVFFLFFLPFSSLVPLGLSGCLVGWMVGSGGGGGEEEKEGGPENE